MVKYNLYDLLELKSKERLSALLTRHQNLTFSDEELTKVNLTRENIYALVAALLKEHAPRGIQLKQYADQSLVNARQRNQPQEGWDDPYDEEKIKHNNNIFNRYMLLRAIFQLMIDQEMTIYWRNQEEIKKISQEISDLLKREKEAKNEQEQRFFQQLNAQRHSLEIARLNQLMEQRSDLLKKAKELTQTQTELKKNIKNLKEMKRGALEQSARKLANKIKQLQSVNEKDYFSQARPQQQQVMIYEIIRLNHKLDVQIHKLDKGINKLEARKIKLMEKNEKILRKEQEQHLLDSVVTPFYGKKKREESKAIRKNNEKIALLNQLINSSQHDHKLVKAKRADQVEIYRQAATAANLPELAQADSQTLNTLHQRLKDHIEPEVLEQNKIADKRRNLKGNLKKVDKNLHKLERRMQENTKQNKKAISHIQEELPSYSNEQQLDITKALTKGAKFEADVAKFYGVDCSLTRPVEMKSSHKPQSRL